MTSPQASTGLGALDEPLDLARVVAVGHSAGGHLAFWAAARRGLAAGAPGAEPRVRVAAAVAQAGVVDLREAARLRLSRDVVRTLLGGPPGKVPKRYDAASPIEQLPLGVPQLLVHGEADDVVPISIARGYAERAAERRRPVPARSARGRRPYGASRPHVGRLAGRDRLAGGAVIERADAERLDAADPLAAFRERFVIDDPETIYLDGNSLGRLPVATRERLRTLTAQWGSDLVTGWHEWIDLPGAGR